MALKTTQKITKMHECFYVLVPKLVRDFLDLEKHDLVEISWHKKVKKQTR